MEQRVRRLLIATLGGAIEWVCLYGAIWLVLLDKHNLDYALALGLMSIVLLISVSVAWSGVLGRNLHIRWQPGFWTIKRVRLWIVAGLLLVTVFLISWLVLQVYLYSRLDSGGLFWTRWLISSVGLPLGGIVVFSIGLLWSFRREWLEGK
jgi:hypothetical protein